MRDELRSVQQRYIDKLAERQSGGKVKSEAGELDEKSLKEVGCGRSCTCHRLTATLCGDSDLCVRSRFRQ